MGVTVEDMKNVSVESTFLFSEKYSIYITTPPLATLNQKHVSDCLYVSRSFLAPETIQYKIMFSHGLFISANHVSIRDIKAVCEDQC